MEALFSAFPKAAIRTLQRLGEPRKIQDFIDFEMGYNFSSFTYSPLEVIKRRKAHCLDGALLAACALRFHGQKPLLVDLRAERDEDHVLAAYRRGKFWGAIAQSKFTGLRFREAIYPSLHALGCSYFDFFYNFRGEKTLREYSEPLDLSKFDDRDWMTTEKDLSWVSDELEGKKHYRILPQKHNRLRLVDSLEFEANARGSGSVPLTQQTRKPIWSKVRKKGVAISRLPRH